LNGYAIHCFSLISSLSASNNNFFSALATKEFKVESIKSEKGNYSWGPSAEKVYYSLGPNAKPMIDKKVEVYFKKK